MKQMEIEYKWDANSNRAFYCAVQTLTKLCGSMNWETLNITDIYLDDRGNQLAKQHVALRIRNTENKWEATYKTRTRLINGKAIRREETIPLKESHSKKDALDQLKQKKKWGKFDVSMLNVQFEIKNRRTVCQVVFDGARAEISLDRVRLCVCGRYVLFKEIELEFKQGNKKSFDQLAALFSRQTKLKGSKFSKVRTAETLLKWWKR